MMNDTMILASLLVTGKSLICTRSDDSLTSMPFCSSGFDLRETVDAKMDSFTNEAETIDVIRSGLGSISKWCKWGIQQLMWMRSSLEQAGPLSWSEFRCLGGEERQRFTDGSRQPRA